MEERVLPIPCYTVSSDGKTALSLDFSRLHSLRLGYGYAELPEVTKGVALPNTTAVWRMDIETGEVTELLKYTDFVNFLPRLEMQEEGSVHKVNHLMFSPNGKRFMVFISLVLWTEEVYSSCDLQCGWLQYVCALRR